MALTTSVAPVLDAGITHEEKSSTAASIEASSKESEIRVVGPNEYKEAAQCLAEAFADDKVVRYPIDTPDREDWSEADKYALHRCALEYITYAHSVKGLVTTIGPNYDCVALWMPPGKNMDDWCTLIRSGMWRLQYKFSAEGRQRFFTEFLPLLHDTKAEVMGDRDNDHWYLVYIGTKAGSRGKGYAKKLIQQITKRADAESRACYLESSNDINPIIYGKMGFKVVKKIHLTRAKKEIEMDIMVREPNPH